MHLSTEDLPAPVGPTRALSSPEYTSRSTLAHEGISLFWSCSRNCLHSPSVFRIGCMGTSLQCRCHQPLGISVLGIFQDLVGQAGFDNPPVLHDKGAASKQADDPEVVGDHHHRG